MVALSGADDADGAVIGSYLGYLEPRDPLRGFLGWVVGERLGLSWHDAAFRVFRLTGSNEVYAYEEDSGSGRVICKFYGSQTGTDPDRAAWLAAREFEGLRTLRGYGLVGSPHHVVRPLAVAPEINAVLALEYYAGESFSHAIARASSDGDDAHLTHRLTSLAYFLATQHNRTAGTQSVDFDVDLQYFDRIVGRLRRRGRLGDADADALGGFRADWRARPRMWQDRQVWLHGDATPANFAFGSGIDVGAFDLERMKRGDRVFDVGRVAGELEHAFELAGDQGRAGGFVGHFLWEYCCHFPDRASAFDSVRARLPFYLGLNLLRIAANRYLSADYAHRLIGLAKERLRAP